MPTIMYQKDDGTKVPVSAGEIYRKYNLPIDERVNYDRKGFFPTSVEPEGNEVTVITGAAVHPELSIEGKLVPDYNPWAYIKTDQDFEIDGKKFRLIKSKWGLNHFGGKRIEDVLD